VRLLFKSEFSQVTFKSLLLEIGSFYGF